jgi:hypothetical protein
MGRKVEAIRRTWRDCKPLRATEMARNLASVYKESAKHIQGARECFAETQKSAGAGTLKEATNQPISSTSSFLPTHSRILYLAPLHCLDFVYGSALLLNMPRVSVVSILFGLVSLPEPRLDSFHPPSMTVCQEGRKTGDRPARETVRRSFLPFHRGRLKEGGTPLSADMSACDMTKIGVVPAQSLQQCRGEVRLPVAIHTKLLKCLPALRITRSHHEAGS